MTVDEAAVFVMIVIVIVIAVSVFVRVRDAVGVFVPMLVRAVVGVDVGRASVARHILLAT